MNIVLLQLPIPKLNYGLKTGNIPLGAACLKQAASKLPGIDIEILPESIASYAGDQALINLIISKKPDMVGFTIFAWNVERSKYFAGELKKQLKTIIIFGGPEVTKDNRIINSPYVDIHIHGEGEEAFVSVLKNTAPYHDTHCSACSESIFKQSKSPYTENLLEPFIENMMLLETQRGCPYKCGFCFYNKSRKSLAFKDTNIVLDGVRWAVENRINELYILDPSLNARPQLKSLLKEIALINRSKKISINSEIRAEWIDEELADLFLNAGFTGFEIGLQSTNKKALKIMNRPTDLNRFLKGARLLKEREILPRIDLIAGLPGDNLDGFSGSIGFVAENDLYDDVQVFPLSILPGTEFRKNHKKLAINYESSPPYNVLNTSSFSKEDMLLAFDYAESLFDINLFPFPFLDLGWKTEVSSEKTKDIKVTIGEQSYITKIILNSYRSFDEIESIGERLTFPWQIFVNSNVMDYEYISKVLNILTIKNPFSAFEIIFLNPGSLPETEQLYKNTRLNKPHFLDNDLRYLFAEKGNRSVLFTMVSDHENYIFSGEMKRQVFLWTKKQMPEQADLDKLSGFDGILIDNTVPEIAATDWQTRFADFQDEIIPVSFSKISLQKDWLMRTAEDDYYFKSMRIV